MRSYLIGVVFILICACGCIQKGGLMPVEQTPTSTPSHNLLNLEHEILSCRFTTDDIFSKEIDNVSSVLLYYYVVINSAEFTGEEPRLSVYSKAYDGKDFWSGRKFQLNLKRVSLPYTLVGDWIYVTGSAKYIVNLTVSGAKVSGELFIVKLHPPKVGYGRYLVKGNRGICAFKIPNNESNLILLEKRPRGGSIEVLQPSKEFSSCFIGSYSHRWWTPTGLVSELGTVVVPSYTVFWGGHRIGNEIVQGGWIKQVFTDGELLVVIKTPEEEFSLNVEEIENLGSPKTAPMLNFGESIALPIANNVEGLFLKVDVPKPRSAVMLELSLGEHDQMWIGASLIRNGCPIGGSMPIPPIAHSNSASNVVSTVGLEIVPKNAKRVLIVLPVKDPGSYVLSLSYNVPNCTNLTLRLAGIEAVDLSDFEYDENWKVWRGRVWVKS